MGNQKEEQLRAFLADYPSELRQKVTEMRQALESEDFEKLQDAAQQAPRCVLAGWDALPLTHSLTDLITYLLTDLLNYLLTY